MERPVRFFLGVGAAGLLAGVIVPLMIGVATVFSQLWYGGPGRTDFIGGLIVEPASRVPSTLWVSIPAAAAFGTLMMLPKARLHARTLGALLGFIAVSSFMGQWSDVSNLADVAAVGWSFLSGVLAGLIGAQTFLTLWNARGFSIVWPNSGG